MVTLHLVGSIFERNSAITTIEIGLRMDLIGHLVGTDFEKMCASYSEDSGGIHGSNRVCGYDEVSSSPDNFH